MTRQILMIVLLIASSSLAFATEVDVYDPMVGLWLIEEKVSIIEISPCYSGICGRIVWLKEPLDDDGSPKRDKKNPDKEHRSRELLGLELLTAEGLGLEDPGAKRAGHIYDAQSGKTYTCVMNMEKDGRLKLRGYVEIALQSRTTRWTRVEEIPKTGRRYEEDENLEAIDRAD